jgi:hypothetical protein
MEKLIRLVYEHDLDSWSELRQLSQNCSEEPAATQNELGKQYKSEHRGSLMRTTFHFPL